MLHFYFIAIHRLPAFFPHVAGVVLTVRCAKKYAEWTWALAGIGLVLEGVACIAIPFCTNYFLLMLPICVICFGIALIDTALLPMLGFIVDKKVSIFHLWPYDSGLNITIHEKTKPMIIILFTLCSTSLFTALSMQLLTSHIVQLTQLVQLSLVTLWKNWVSPHWIWVLRYSV